MKGIYAVGILSLMVCGALAAPAYNMFGTGLGNGYSTGYSTGGGLLGGSFLGGSGLNGGAFGNTPNLVGRSLYPNTQLGGSVWPNTQNFATGGLYNQNMLPYNSAYGTNRNGMLNVNPMGVQNTGFGIAQTSMQDALLMQNPVVKNLLRNYQSNGLPLDQFIFDLNSAAQLGQIRPDQAQLLQQMVRQGQIQRIPFGQSQMLSTGQFPLF